ncbi:hypothetical protein MSG28_005322 [Choristoneura fumiferana]|uniref:Uncharacterized protein n=1 Tax=Choristoneura fumiferana TaxID=7141 RepID=A0ACC0JQW5_CHOFU|nr:hypothetical protein MSG28_005322 [Choristoneura fumiferana]
MKHQMRRKYRIESLSAATFPGALKVIREAFFQDEAVCIGTEIHKDPEAIEELLELCASAALDGVSLVAVARQKERYMTPTPFTSMELRYPSPVASDSTEKTFLDLFEERNTRPSCLSLVHFIKDVEGRCNFFEKYHADCCLDITWLAVLREHRGRNLATLLCKLSVDLAKKLRDGPVSTFTVKDCGPKFAYLKTRDVTDKVPTVCTSIWSSEFTRRIGKKMGFKVEVSVPMSQFVFNGKSYADRLGDESAFSELVALELA